MGKKLTTTSFTGVVVCAALAALLLSPLFASAEVNERRGSDERRGKKERSTKPPSTSGVGAMVDAQLCMQHKIFASIPFMPKLFADKCKDQPPPPPEPEEPTVDITATPTTIIAGDSSELSWNSENADECVASNGWTGAKALDGEQNVSPTVTTTYTIQCSGEGGTAEDSVTVTVNQPELETASLTLVKVVVNNNNGTAEADDWTLDADGPDDISGVTGTAAVTDVEVDVGTYTLSESGGPSGYTASQYSCVKNGGAAILGNSITLADGDDATCTITNDDNAPEMGTLVVRKVVVRDNGGDAATTTFSFQIDGGAATAFEADGENSVTVSVGTHSVVEVAVDGYTTSYDNCANVAVANGETETCTITNNDVAPQADPPELTFTASRITVHEGSLSEATTTLTWDSTNTDSCTASGAAEWTGGKSVDGSEVVTPTADVTYVLNCSGAGGSVEEEVMIDFVPETPAEGKLLITEILYDAGTGQGSEPANEWVELYNGTDNDIDLTGFYIHDAVGADKLPSVVLPAGSFAVITGSTTTEPLWEGLGMPADTLMLVLGNASIGSNGLGNTTPGDYVWLESNASTTIDAMNYGTSTQAFSPSIPHVSAAGHSLARSSILLDTDAAGDWIDRESPNPGQ